MNIDDLITEIKELRAAILVNAVFTAELVLLQRKYLHKLAFLNEDELMESLKSEDEVFSQLARIKGKEGIL